MADKNALIALDELRPKAEREKDMAVRAARDLAEALGLPDAPVRVECFDISNIQGTNAVGSMVVFSDGLPKKEDYRHFKVKSVKGPDDFAMMGEVLERRFKRGQRERDVDGTRGSFATFPDLLVVDGGKGQLGVAVEVLASLGIELPVIGLAKREEEVFVPGRSEPVLLPRESQGLMLLQRIRDEAHRFAVGYHRKLRSGESRRSILDEIPGVGPRRRAALLKRFGTIRAISEATAEELSRTPGMNRTAAQRVLAHLTTRTH
jgi:excinuclease ABC subunit C